MFVIPVSPAPHSPRITLPQIKKPPLSRGGLVGLSISMRLSAASLSTSLDLAFLYNKKAKSKRLGLKRRLPTLPQLNAVPSALVSLTSLFGMGRGGTSLLLPP